MLLRPQTPVEGLVCVLETLYGDTEFQEFLNCKNHDGRIFIKMMLCILFSVNKMHQVYFKGTPAKAFRKKKYQHTLCIKRKEGKDCACLI